MTITTGVTEIASPRGSCMVCGHDKPYAVWEPRGRYGVCRTCRDEGQRAELARVDPYRPAREWLLILERMVPTLILIAFVIYEAAK